jgi:hypothetical protein
MYKHVIIIAISPSSNVGSFIMDEPCFPEKMLPMFCLKRDGLTFCVLGPQQGKTDLAWGISGANV